MCKTIVLEAFRKGELFLPKPMVDYVSKAFTNYFSVLCYN
ncbi:hypothetical protein CCAND93_230005 [Capnocytophaga canis]|nr:hypothetical protein CCAND93_230005 [Capnocytophaga canis]